MLPTLSFEFTSKLDYVDPDDPEESGEYVLDALPPYQRHDGACRLRAREFGLNQGTYRVTLEPTDVPRTLDGFMTTMPESFTAIKALGVKGIDCFLPNELYGYLMYVPVEIWDQMDFEIRYKLILERIGDLPYRLTVPSVKGKI